MPLGNNNFRLAIQVVRQFLGQTEERRIHFCSPLFDMNIAIHFLARRVSNMVDLQLTRYIAFVISEMRLKLLCSELRHGGPS